MCSISLSLSLSLSLSHVCTLSHGHSPLHTLSFNLTHSKTYLTRTGQEESITSLFNTPTCTSTHTLTPHKLIYTHTRKRSPSLYHSFFSGFANDVFDVLLRLPRSESPSLKKKFLSQNRSAAFERLRMVDQHWPK